MPSLSALTAILLAGIVAGTVDIGAASLINGRDPIFISQLIAGGLLGKDALQGGMRIAALGLVLQWAMSALIAAIFVTASGMWPMLRQHWLGSGIAYGVPVYFVMEYVVVPLSAWHRAPKFSVVPFCENMAAMMVFGVIAAWFASLIR
ncbi:MAG TPA: hypothetical protein VHZ29_04180 [Rhizomicrobium sp.]|jgi:uncharacterized membrane protein YagU involved in acid resistance|nr:hypothetical protein [Rhizomicrobium sp.]